MPSTKAGRPLTRWRLLAAMAVALPVLPSASVRADDLLPPVSAKSGGNPSKDAPPPMPAPADGGGQNLPIPSEPPKLPTGPEPQEAPPPFQPGPAEPQVPEPKQPAPAKPVPTRPTPTPSPTPTPAGEPSAEPNRGTTRPLGRSVDLSTRDPQAMPARAAGEADGENPLPAAIQGKPGGAAAPSAGESVKGQQPDGFALSSDRLPVGRQAVGLSIEVVAPAVMNINHPATVKLIVKNTGNTDVATVRARYDLPKELTLVSSQPTAERASADDPSLHFMLNTVAAGSDRVITLKVKAKEVATIDHVAHVYVVAGSRAPSVIQEPKLRVEMPNPTPSKVLKGQQVQFKIAVKNVGNGPARDVEVAAKFSSGLKADENDLVGQTIPVIQPGETVSLDPLIVDTFAGGEQTCKVTINSPDVAPNAGEMSVTRSVFVTKPDLALKLEGPAKRFTDTLADYRLVVENPGTAPAKNVTVTAVLPTSGGRLTAIPPGGAEWNKTDRRLQWVIANLDPGEKTALSFQVRLGGMGLYQVTAEARCKDLLDKESFSTDVSGLPDVVMVLTERRRVLDVNEYTVFDIKIQNKGTKEATNLKLSAILSKNLIATDAAGIDTDQDIGRNDETGEVRFPVIERLAPGRTMELSIKAQAKGAGVGTCKVYLEHDDLPNTKLEDFAHTTVTGGADSRLK